MGYENAIQTKMLATHCAVCGRALVDSKSVECGIGPDCREKHGYNIDVSEAARTAANIVVYQIALNRHEPELCMEHCNTLRTLGFTHLAHVVLSRIAAVVIEEKDGLLFVKTEYNEAAVSAMRTVPGRRWNKDTKTNTFPVTSKRALLAYLSNWYAGKIGVGGKGGFVIPALGEKVAAAPAPRQAAPVLPDNVCQQCMTVRCPDGCCCSC